MILLSFSLKPLYLPPQHRIFLLQHLDLAGIDILLILAHLILHQFHPLREAKCGDGLIGVAAVH